MCQCQVCVVSLVSITAVIACLYIVTLVTLVSLNTLTNPALINVDHLKTVNHAATVTMLRVRLQTASIQ